MDGLRLHSGLEGVVSAQGSHLHCQNEAMTVQGVLPIQQAIQGESPTDVVQGKNAVGISCKTESQSHERLAERCRVKAYTPPQGVKFSRL